MTILFFAMVINTIFVACGSDGSDDDSTSITDFPSDVRPFIGKWYITKGQSPSSEFPNYEAFLFQEGKCKVVQHYQDGTKYGRENNYDNLDWVYDNSTKRLVIAGLANAQWEITAQGDNTWTGLSLWGGGQQGYVAKKDTTVKEIFNYLLVSFSWKNAGA